MAAPAAQGVTSVTVTPNTSLTDGQTVTVTASGFAPNSSLFTLQCTANPVSYSDCDPNSQDFVDTGPTGGGSAPFVVRRRTGGSQVIVCNETTPCSVQVSQDLTDFTQPRAFQQITFAAPTPPPAVPESKFAVVLPAGAAALFVGAFLMLRRRRDTAAS